MIQDFLPLAIAVAIVLGFGLARLKQHPKMESNEGKKQAKPSKSAKRRNRKILKGRRLQKSGETYLKRVK